MRFSLATLFLLTLTSAFANWPEFRGPNRDGHAPTGAKLPTEWAEDKNVAWKTEIHGKGWSTPAIWGNQVWVTTATDDGKKQSVLCLDKETGKILLDQVLFENKEPRPLSNSRNTYASSSPTIEEGRVYLHFGSYGTAAFDTTTMKEVWRVGDDVLPCHHWRGPASSPVIYKNLLILTFDGADLQYTAALHKETGAVAWKKDRETNYDDIDPKTGKPKADGDWRKAYSTPVFIELGGKTVMLSSGAKAVWAHEPESGDSIWSLHWPQHSAASRTVFSKELGLMFLNTGYGKSQLWAAKIDPSAHGEISETHVEWKQTKRMPNRCSPVLVGEELYVLSDQGVASCLNAKTGKEIWSERISDIPFSSSIFYGGGNLYFFDEGGKGIVVKPGDTFQKIAENTLDTGMFACPAISGDALFLRTTTHLYRVQN